MHIVVVVGEKTILDTEYTGVAGLRPELLPYKWALDSLTQEWIRVAIQAQIPTPYRDIMVK